MKESPSLSCQGQRTLVLNIPYYVCIADLRSVERACVDELECFQSIFPLSFGYLCLARGVCGLRLCLQSHTTREHIETLKFC